jgi:hypothetical protein
MYMKKSKQAWTNARRAKFERTIAARKAVRKVFAKAGRRDAKNVAEVFNESPATTVRATDSGFVIDVTGAQQQLTILRHLLQTVSKVSEDDYIVLTAEHGLRVIDGLFSRIR